MAKKTGYRETVNFALALLLVLAVFTAYTLYVKHEPSDVVARVNDEPIYEHDTRNSTLHTAVTRELLLQAAERRDITVSQEEIEATINATAAAQGLTSKAFTTILERQGLSQDMIHDRAEDRVKLDKLFDEVITVKVSDAEIQRYYDKHKTAFTRPARVTVHEVNCTRCRFNVTNGTVSPHVFNRLYTARPGRIVTVNDTRVGVVRSHEAGLTSLASVAPRIEEVLRQRKQRHAVQDYVAALRENASVTYQTSPTRRNWSCLRRNATLYGASWDSQTREQLDVLGDVSRHVRYVECSGDTFNTPRCEKVGVEAFPTWIVNGELHVGMQSRSRLYALACT